MEEPIYQFHIDKEILDYPFGELLGGLEAYLDLKGSIKAELEIKTECFRFLLTAEKVTQQIGSGQ